MVTTTIIGVSFSLATHVALRTMSGRSFAAATVAGVVASSSIISAQACTYSASSADQSSNGMFGLQAGTTQDNCVGRTARVEGWIAQKPTSCHPVEEQDGARCVKEETDGETNAGIFGTSPGCGVATGLSNHSMWNPHVEIQNQRQTPLNAGDCPSPPSCEDQCGSDEQCLCECEGYERMPGVDGGEPWCNRPQTPIIISLEKNSKYHLTTVKQGVRFDLDADGIPEQTAWTRHDSNVAFLAIDRNGDGAITSGRELFGNQTVPEVTNGFIALRKMMLEANGGVLRGMLDTEEPLFAQLLLWTDANHNGISESWELRRASESLSSIGLHYEFTTIRDQFGNRFLLRGGAHLRTGPGKNLPNTAEEDHERTIEIWDVIFASK